MADLLSRALLHLVGFGFGIVAGCLLTGLIDSVVPRLGLADAMTDGMHSVARGRGEVAHGAARFIETLMRS